MSCKIVKEWAKAGSLWTTKFYSEKNSTWPPLVEMYTFAQGTTLEKM